MSDRILEEIIRDYFNGTTDPSFTDAPDLLRQSAGVLSDLRTNLTKAETRLDEARDEIESLWVTLGGYRDEQAKAEERIAELEEILREADQYLSPHPANYIGCGSILHLKFRQALATKPQEAEADGECRYCGGEGCVACDARYLPESPKP